MCLTAEGLDYLFEKLVRPHIGKFPGPPILPVTVPFLAQQQVCAGRVSLPAGERVPNVGLVVPSFVAAGTTITLPYPFVSLVTPLVHFVPVLVNRCRRGVNPYRRGVNRYRRGVNRYRRGVNRYRRGHLELLTGRRWVPVLRGCESFTADASLSKRGYG